MKLCFHQIWNATIRRLFYYYKRQQFHVCQVKLTSSELMHKLIPLGYQFNYFGLRDTGEVANARKLYMCDGSIRQIHVRLYYDGEVRAHDEMSYEEDIIKHIMETDMRCVGDKEINLIMETLYN